MSPSLNFSVHAIRVNQREKADQAIFIASVKAKEFLDRPSERFKIDLFRRENGRDSGYQRALSAQAVDKIKNYILTETSAPILPTGMLVNARNPLDFKVEKGNFGILKIDQPLFIIDGQHRFEAWKQMMTTPEIEAKYGDFEFPVVILSNFKVLNEIEQFYIINSRQRKIKTDLAQRNLLRLAESDDTMGLVPAKLKWTNYAAKMVDILNEEIDGSIWQHGIVLPDDKPDIKKLKSINQVSFVASLKPFFVGKDAIFTVGESGRPEIEKWAHFISDYWDTVDKVFPEAVRDIHNYSLRKAVGVFALHILLAQFIEKNENSRTIFEPANKAAIFAKIEGVLRKASKKATPLDFWRKKVPESVRARGECVGAFSSSSGQEILAQKIYFA